MWRVFPSANENDGQQLGGRCTTLGDSKAPTYGLLKSHVLSIVADRDIVSRGLLTALCELSTDTTPRLINTAPAPEQLRSDPTKHSLWDLHIQTNFGNHDPKRKYSVSACMTGTYLFSDLQIQAATGCQPQQDIQMQAACSVVGPDAGSEPSGRITRH